jgi:hypothetical protein
LSDSDGSGKLSYAATIYFVDPATFHELFERETKKPSGGAVISSEDAGTGVTHSELRPVGKFEPNPQCSGSARICGSNPVRYWLSVTERWDNAGADNFD